VLLEGAVGTAIAVNELSPARARAVWDAVRAGTCYRTLDPKVQVWADLFAAVAARDAARMSELGTRAIETAPTAFARDYALSAAVAADVALKRGEPAGLLLQMHAPSQETVWTMIMREATAGRTIARRQP
jgi:hypothetical protein